MVSPFVLVDRKNGGGRRDVYEIWFLSEERNVATYEGGPVSAYTVSVYEVMRSYCRQYCACTRRLAEGSFVVFGEGVGRGQC